MANYFPLGYQPAYYQQNVQPTIQPNVQQNVQPTIQNGGFVNVQSEKEAINYPIANGTSITFFDAPHMKLYVKIKGFSPMEQPTIKYYDIVEATGGESVLETHDNGNSIEYAEKGEIEALKGEIKHIKDDIKKLSEVNTDE